MTTLINKVLGENEKWVFYFHVKLEGTFWAPKYTHTQRASEYTATPTPPPHTHWAFLVAQLIKNPPAMQETWFQSLGWQGPLEKGKATHSSILAWRIPWTDRSGGCKESDTTERLSLTHRYCKTIEGC